MYVIAVEDGIGEFFPQIAGTKLRTTTQPALQSIAPLHPRTGGKNGERQAINVNIRKENHHKHHHKDREENDPNSKHSVEHGKADTTTTISAVENNIDEK